MLHGHLLSVLLLIPFGGLLVLVADIWRREPAERAGMLGPALGAVAILTVGYLPALICQRRNGFPEISAISEYLANGPGIASVPGHLPVITWRA